jgi:hypothetical protein
MPDRSKVHRITTFDAVHRHIRHMLLYMTVTDDEAVSCLHRKKRHSIVQLSKEIDQAISWCKMNSGISICIFVHNSCSSLAGHIQGKLQP